MAYPQRPAQRPPPMRNYGPRAPPSGGPPQDGYYDQAYYDQGYDYQYADAGYDASGYGYPGDAAVPRSYGPPRGAPRPPRGAYPPAEQNSDRGYAYSGRPPPNGYDGRRDRRGPPPGSERMRPVPRGPPTEPDKMSWDNPFPMFPSKQPSGRSRGIEGGMARMDLNGPPRPHTSNSRRPGPPTDSRGRGYGPPPMRSASAGRPTAGAGGYDRSYTDPGAAPPPVPHINRSATMPVHSDAMDGPMGSSRYPGQSTYQYPHHEEHNDTEDLLDSYYNSAPTDEADMPNFDAMPDTKANPIDESLPGLETPKPKMSMESAPSGNQYTAFSPRSADISHSKSQPNMKPGSAPNQFEDAGFQFDLPGHGAAGGAYYGMGPNGHEDQMQAQYSQRQGSRGATVDGYGPPRPYRANQPEYNSQTPMVNEAETMDPQNPDALPHHPVPFRPGHDQGAKPAPVRQYTSTPAPQPATPPSAPATSTPTPVTHEELQRLQQTVKGRPSDQKTQLLLAKKLVEASVVLVENTHMDTKTKTKAREKYVTDAYKIVKKLASSGYAEAQFYLADCYGQGQLGLQIDNKEAFNLYHSAAKSGHAQSAYRVAVCCEIGAEEGGGTKRDPFKAVQWYKRAASLGDPPAMYKMGMILLKGLLGQEKNPREGVSWLKRAAERADVENPHALHELALMYANAGPNDVIIRDEAYACQLFHQAAELGYKFSQFSLGAAYEYGLMGCPVDPRQSIIWYTNAAAQGEHQSELALSGWYLTGSDGILQQNDTEAYLWARKAATSGLAKAEYAMGYFTEVGIGIAANLDDAKRWYWRAAAQGFPKARERLEELKKGGARMQKTRLSRSAVNQQKQNEGDCLVM
ncbi:chitin synthase activator [Aspergillus terreus]|uniref:Chitin synthase activator n=1 Tax=Aspergillus terreus TaxID=33178 RepID=A0A5M3Z7A4_ASPTE|nr:hypothetical protein ATETN484_0008038000 [Aspergillus terreus]GFF21208.1 chitin synthase activator [Aspergillus terreus]